MATLWRATRRLSNHLLQRPSTNSARAADPAADARLAAGRSEIFALSFGLAALLIAAKFVLLPFPVETLGQFARWLLRLALVAAPDVCFVAAACVVSLMGNRLLARSRVVHGCARMIGFAGFYLLGIFGVASVGIYRSTMAPLSWQGLEMAGGAETFSSSIAAYVSLGTVLALMLAPALVIVLPFAVRRLERWRTAGSSLHKQSPTRTSKTALRMRYAVVTLLAIATYGVISRTYIHAKWTDPNRWERRIAQSPHAVFLQSMLTSLLWGQSLPLGGEEADLSDFAERAPNPSTYSPSMPRPKNVLVIVLESTAMEYTSLARPRADGPAANLLHATTPRLAEAARRGGVTFENFYVQAPSSCKSLASLTASVYPRTDWWLLVRDNPNFAVPTIAEELVQRGYRTCFAHSGYWSWQQRDVFLKTRGGQTLLDADSISAEKINSWGIRDKDMFDAVVDWIDQDPEQPFYALAYTVETHHPYVVHPPEIDFGVDDPTFNRYLNSLHETDRQIGQLLDKLKQRGLLEDTLIAITADHGESFGQHNQRIHSFAVYDAAIHVPLVLLHPSLAQEQRRDDRLCAQVDLAPTIMDVLSLPVPDDWQGESLFAEQPHQRNYFFCTGNEIILGLREGSLKYHYYVESGFEELFDLATDPGETLNLAENADAELEPAKRMAEFRRRLAGFVRYQHEFLDAKLMR